MAKAEPAEFGHLVKAIKEKGKGEKERKPFLNITARMDNDLYGPMEASGPNSDWRKKELERYRKEVKAMEDEIAGWDAEKVSERALKSLKVELAVKKARVMESEAMLGEDSEE